MIIRLLW